MRTSSESALAFNSFAEAEAQAMRDLYGACAEDRCIEEYLSLASGDGRGAMITRVLAFLEWTVDEPRTWSAAAQA